jgi:hypothetical protein
MRFRTSLMEFLAAIMGDHACGYVGSKRRFLARHGISREQLNAMRRACRRGRFRIRRRMGGMCEANVASPGGASLSRQRPPAHDRGEAW